MMVMKNSFQFNSFEEDRKLNKTKIFGMIMIIIIVVLFLITNCSCVANFFGKIGSSIVNEGQHQIEPNTNDKEVVKNKYLKFDSDNVEISLSDSNYKLTYSYEYIIPKNLTCSTSNAKVATCFVENGYVVINPKELGEVTVTLNSEANDKIYIATTNVKITEAKRKIELSGDKGTVNLNKTIKITYNLVGLTGSVKVTSSDESIATVSLGKDRVITITGKKVGNASIKVSMEYNGKSYEAIYWVTVVDVKSPTPTKPIVPNVPSEPQDPSGSGDEYQIVRKLVLKGPYNVDINQSSYPIIYEIADFRYDNNEKLYEIEDAMYDKYLSENKISVRLDGDVKSQVILSNDRKKITLSIDKTDVGKVADLVVTFDGQEVREKVNFMSGYFDLETATYQYGMSYSPSTLIQNEELDVNERNIVFKTNIFETSERVIKAATSTNNTLILVDRDDNKKKITIETMSGESLIDLDYRNIDTKGVDTYAVSVRAKGEGVVKFKITMSYNDITLKELKDITLFIERKYVVILDAGDGVFDIIGKRYLFLEDLNVDIDLNNYPSPYKMDATSGSDCKTYKFLGYVDSANNEILKDSANYKFKITEDTVLTAKYEDVSNEQIFNPRTLWLTDIDLFYNKETGIEKEVQPGTNGFYTEKLTNNTGKTVKITKLKLKEETICIYNKGCLNMGYVIRYYQKIDGTPDRFNLLVGTSVNDKNYYVRLWENNKSLYQSNFGTNYKDLSSGNKGAVKDYVYNYDNINITLQPNETIELYFAWEWKFETGNSKEEIRQNDILDTLVAEYASKYKDAIMNNNYKLSIGIEFEDNTCPIKNS